VFNGVTFNSSAFNGGQPGGILKADPESTAAIVEADVVGVGAEAAERLWLNPESDRPGAAGAFGSFTFNGAGYNSAVRRVGLDWAIVAGFTDSEATQAISEVDRIVQRIVLSLGSPGGSFIRIEGLQMEWNLNQRARCSFEVIYPGAASSYYTPRPGHQVQILDFDNATVLFAGSIEQVDDMLLWSPGSNKLQTRCTAVGWEQIADRFLVSDSAHQVYASQTLKAIVEDLVATYLAADGVTATGLPTGPTLDRVVFSYVSRVSDAFNELSRLTGYWWRMDNDRNVEFYQPSSAAASGLSITSSSANHIGSVRVRRDRSQYRNKQYLSNVVVTVSPDSEEFPGDRTNQAFALRYEVYSVPTITVNGTPATVGIRDIDSGKDFYWSKGSADIVPADGASRISADTVAVTYTGQYEMIRAVTDSAEVTDRANIEGGSGVYEWITGDGVAMNTADAADAFAQALIDRHAPIPSIVTIETDTTGVRPGSYIPITLADLGLDGDFFVRRVSAAILSGSGGSRLRYTIEASSNEPEEAWSAAFAKKAPAKDMTSLPTAGI
jgi:hypothetical protein